MKKNSRLEFAEIAYTNERGDEEVLRALSLIALFSSQSFIKEFKKNPNKEFSIKELVELADSGFCNEGTLRNAIKAYREFFNKPKASAEIRKRGVVRVNLIQLKNAVNQVIDAVNDMKKDM